MFSDGSSLLRGDCRIVGPKRLVLDENGFLSKERHSLAWDHFFPNFFGSEDSSCSTSALRECCREGRS